MFAQLAALALLLPFASAVITLSAPTNASPGGTVTITWTASTSDPAYFSLELVNDAFNHEYAIANNVQTSLGSITLTLPQVDPGSDYSLNAVATNDVNTVYSSTGTFSVSAASSSSSSATSATSTGSSTSSESSTSSATASTPLTTATATTTGSLSSVSSLTVRSSSASASGTSSASSSPSSLSGGAAALKVPGMVPAAALVLSAVAGAAMVF